MWGSCQSSLSLCIALPPPATPPSSQRPPILPSPAEVLPPNHREQFSPWLQDRRRSPIALQDLISSMTTIHMLSRLPQCRAPFGLLGPMLCLMNGRHSITIDSFHFCVLFPGFTLVSYMFHYFPCYDKLSNTKLQNLTFFPQCCLLMLFVALAFALNVRDMATAAPSKCLLPAEQSSRPHILSHVPASPLLQVDSWVPMRMGDCSRTPGAHITFPIKHFSLPRRPHKS